MKISKNVSIHDLIPLIEEKLNSSSEVIITVSGNSMYPFFVDKATNVTLVKPIKALKRMDIALYKTPTNIYALHRIIKVKKDEYVICGDALKQKEYINKDKIIGVVKSYRYNSKHINCNSISYRFKANLWVFLYPIRKYLLYIIRKIDKRIKKNN